MNKQDIIDFFDSLAPTWDADMIRSDEVIGVILDNAHVREGSRVLDVACGTGVLIPDYIKRNVQSVTAVDISPKMIAEARAKFTDPRVSFVLGDAENTDVGSGFDCIVIYNAFPHFPRPEELIGRLSALLAPGGCLTVAHGMSREKIDRHHEGSARHVSVGLMDEQALAGIFSKYLRVETVISDGRMYQVTGIR